MTYPASPRQISFVNTLLVEREHSYQITSGAGLNGKQASAYISALLRAPKKATATVTADTEPGVYVLAEGVIVKLQFNKNKSNIYALVWTSINGERLTLNHEVVNAHWSYAPELKSLCTEEVRMTIEQAQAFTLLYGECVRCGRTLVAAKSVLDGIGPVCGKTFRGYRAA